MPHQLFTDLGNAKSIRMLVEEVESAPNVQEHLTPGFDEPRFRLPTTPAVVGLISLQGEMMPAADAAAALGIYYGEADTPPPGKVLKLSGEIAKQWRFIRAGGNLAIANDCPEGITNGRDLAFFTRLQRFRNIRPAQFSALADGAWAAMSPYPAAQAVVTMGDAPNYSTRFELTRKKFKELPAQLVAYEITWSVARGVANLVETVMLTAINAVADNFSFVAMAAKDVEADALRAIAGTSGTQFSFNSSGAPVVLGMPAALSGAIAGTLAGDWSKAFAVLADDVMLTIRRTGIAGTLEISAHCNLKPAIPDAQYFGKVL